MSVTKAVLEKYLQELGHLVSNFDSHIKEIQEKYKVLIQEAGEWRKKARTYRTAIGSAMQTTDGQIFGGFNIENTSRSWDDHAEKITTIHAMLYGYEGIKLRALAIVAKGGVYTSYACPACGYCLQYLWERAHPDLLLIDADTEGNVQIAIPLKLAYRLAWPEKPLPNTKVE